MKTLSKKNCNGLCDLYNHGICHNFCLLTEAQKQKLSLHYQQRKKRQQQREALTIITIPFEEKFHFCREDLAGADHNLWHSFKGKDLFDCVETKLKELKVAHNVVCIERLRESGQSRDYQVTYNKY